MSARCSKERVLYESFEIKPAPMFLSSSTTLKGLFLTNLHHKICVRDFHHFSYSKSKCLNPPNIDFIGGIDICL